MRKQDVKDISQLEEYYSKSRKIKFQEKDKNDKLIKIITVNDIIEKLLVEQECTLYVKNSVHCVTYRSRSFNDYFIICKYYFPKLTVKDCAKALYLYEESIKQSIEKLFNVRYCPNIRKTNTTGLTHKSWNRGVNDYRFGIDLGFNQIKPTLEQIINL